MVNPTNNQLSFTTAEQTLVKVAIPVPLRRVFDYLLPENYPITPQAGMRVEVPFGSSSKIGVIHSVEALNDCELEFDFSKLKTLNRILDEAHARGMYYLGDVGAGSASPETHQWDNGGDPLGEFERVMQVRSIALQNLSVSNIRVGDPYAKLTEVLVPVYLFHRYQTEALSKSVGGVDYRFAIRGDERTREVINPRLSVIVILER